MRFDKNFAISTNYLLNGTFCFVTFNFRFILPFRYNNDKSDQTEYFQNTLHNVHLVIFNHMSWAYVFRLSFGIQLVTFYIAYYKSDQTYYAKKRASGHHVWSYEVKSLYWTTRQANFRAASLPVHSAWKIIRASKLLFLKVTRF